MTYEAMTPQQKARIAFMRFGLGPKPGGAARIGMEPSSALKACLAELDNSDPVQVSDRRLPSAATAGLAALNKPSGSWIPISGVERAVRYGMAMRPEVGFLERLVLFWANHFAVYTGKVRATAGLMEREVIRPNVLGKFSDMLRGVAQHPAMIAYLDNQVSVSPTSKIGIKNGWSYNENLAREILELHTLGVGGGYTQDDVTNFAKILTGWTTDSTTGLFTFRADYHDQNNAAVNFMGKTYDQAGQAQGIAVLADLAASPATAQHIAFKLIRHFVTDDPPPDMVERLTDVFISTDGDLKALAQALLREPLSWTAPVNRIRLPYVWLLSVIRAFNIDDETAFSGAWRFDVFLGVMGHTYMYHLTPDGYSDENYIWEDPNAIRVRKDVASRLVSLYGGNGRGSASTALVATVADNLLPGTFSPESLAAVASTTNQQSAYNVLFASPEFLRR